MPLRRSASQIVRRQRRSAGPGGPSRRPSAPRADGPPWRRARRPPAARASPRPSNRGRRHGSLAASSRTPIPGETRRPGASLAPGDPGRVDLAPQLPREPQEHGPEPVRELDFVNQGNVHLVNDIGVNVRAWFGSRRRVLEQLLPVPFGVQRAPRSPRAGAPTRPASRGCGIPSSSTLAGMASIPTAARIASRSPRLASPCSATKSIQYSLSACRIRDEYGHPLRLEEVQTSARSSAPGRACPSRGLVVAR